MNFNYHVLSRVSNDRIKCGMNYFCQASTLNPYRFQIKMKLLFRSNNSAFEKSVSKDTRDVNRISSAGRDPARHLIFIRELVVPDLIS